MIAAPKYTEMNLQEQNSLLTQTNHGTPCGELMRRYWQPAALSRELAADKPLAVALFGEELILFRDDHGHPALIGRYCAHQGVDMIYGRVEADGIRCMYHGWLFDGCGRVVVRGDWLPGGEQRMAVGQPAYPCLEGAGLIFTYMGPGETPAPAAQQFFSMPMQLPPTRVLRAENYFQSMFRTGEAPLGGARFALPNLIAAQEPSSEKFVRWHVPVDDQSNMEFTVRCVGEPAVTVEPPDAARQMLLEAIEGLRTQERNSPQASAKNF
jgi:nitrite reductase/ring-hydroxylating ferredoxin subunit